MQSDIKMIDLFQNTEKKPVEQKYDPQNLFSLIYNSENGLNSLQKNQW